MPEKQQEGGFQRIVERIFEDILDQLPDRPVHVLCQRLIVHTRSFFASQLCMP